GLVFTSTMTQSDSGVTALDLVYGSKEIQEFAQQANGSPSQTPYAESAWDRVHNVSGFSTAVDGGETTPNAPLLTLPDSGVSAATAGSDMAYYVRFTLGNGTTISVDGDTLFGINELTLKDHNAVSIDALTGGVGVGKATFDPLQLKLSQPSLDPQLFQ